VSYKIHSERVNVIGCQCSNIPTNLKIIRVGDSEVDLLDLKRNLSCLPVLIIRLALKWQKGCFFTIEAS